MARTMRKTSAWQKTRKVFNDIHLWTGLISGIIVIVICFSGTIYTYNTELREWAAPHLFKVHVPTGAERLPVDSLIPKIAERSGGTVTAITVPADPTRTYQVATRIKGDQSRFGTTYYVNPYDGNVTGTSKEKTKTAEFLQTLFSLHRWLLLDRIEKPLFGKLPNRQLGSYISGTATILFTLGVLTGMVIWFPQKLRNWRRGLTIKWKANWKRVNHDLHNTLAFYSLIFLFVMGITGPQWSFPWYRTGLQKTLGTYKEQPAGRGGAGHGRGGGGRGIDERSKTIRKDQTYLPLFPVSTYLAAADQVLPYVGDYRLTLPQDADSPVLVTKNRTGFFAPAAGDQVSLDASTAAIKDIQIFRKKPLNERVVGSIKALHVGDVYGQFTKLIYFLACLIATSLPITGTLIWVNKMKKKNNR